MQTGLGSDPFDTLDWVMVDSLQPTLRWEPFPGTTQAYPGGEIKPFVDVAPASVSDVTFHLRIWAVSGGVPAGLVYEREGIAEPFHRLESPLQPNAKYEWSLSQLPCPPAYGPDCARGVARQTGIIPSPNYFRFKTPKQ
jgi:hypothetical protein